MVLNLAQPGEGEPGAADGAPSQPSFPVRLCPAPDTLQLEVRPVTREPSPRIVGDVVFPALSRPGASTPDALPHAPHTLS